MEITLAQPADFPAILELQDRFHLSNLPADDLAEGFVTSHLDPKDLARMCQQKAIWVARASDQIAAYACAVEWEFWEAGRFLDAVRALLPIGQVTWENSFLYGPTCIDAPFRGRGILPDFVRAIAARYASEREFGLCFIDVRNARSLAAHERKLGFARIAQLPFDDVVYDVLSFQTA